MKRTLGLFGLAVALISSPNLLARSPSDYKVKVKDGWQSKQAPCSARRGGGRLKAGSCAGLVDDKPYNPNP